MNNIVSLIFIYKVYPVTELLLLIINKESVKSEYDILLFRPMEHTREERRV